MNSIDKNQPEKNLEDLSSEQAAKRVKEMITDDNTCFFSTVGNVGRTHGTRPMSVLQADDDGTLWFMSASDSHKNIDITADPSVSLHFKGSAHSDFLFLTGKASISTDRKKIDELWKPIIKTWFTEGKDDPRITVIKFIPTDGYYWDTKHGNIVAGLKMAIGALTGQTLDDSIQGKIKL
ncbi:MAG: pyridoxamine 5'-phosphate oxidase family protein [Chitinophagaceae bacterium]